MLSGWGPWRGGRRRLFFLESTAVFASGLVGIALALYLFANLPITSAWVLGFLLGILLVSEGAALAYLAWRVRAS